MVSITAVILPTVYEWFADSTHRQLQRVTQVWAHYDVAVIFWKTVGPLG